MPSALAMLDVLVVDGQSTGASPAHGHLFELGWARTRAASHPGESPDVEARLIALPAGATVPRPVMRLTGIGLDDLVGAEEPATVWAALRAAAMPGGVACPVVIHYARFELSFLRALHEAMGDGEPFPLSPLCTHRIAQRLLPDLPRRGLRALAGYLGHGVDALKRSTEHVRATAFVWHHLVARLGDEHGIDTLEALEQWLSQPPPPRAARRAYPMARDKRLALPDAPGVYRMCRSDGSVLYVGKAMSLRARVNGYFRQHRRVPDRTLEMLTQARELDVTVTATAVEAALLETDQIKAHAPPYNVMLRGEGPGPWYASPDLRRWSEQADGLHRVGPLGNRRMVEAWAALARSTPASTPPPAWAQLWGWPEELPAEIWAEGWARFVDTWGDAAVLPRARGLARVGAAIWQAWRTSDDASSRAEPERISEGSVSTDSEGSSSRGEPELASWDPQRVAAVIERVVVGGAHELRRAAWLRRLATGSVAWTRRDGEMWRGLVLRAGDIIQRVDLACRDPMPDPPQWARAVSGEPSSFDIATFDRLRVLTAELRRVITEGRDVELRCSPRAIMTTERLRRTLRWV